MFKNKLVLTVLIATLLLSATLFGSCDDTQKDDPFTVDTITPPDVNDATDTTEAVEDTTEPPAVDPVIVEPDIINPLTGLEADVDYELRRPIAIMINNIKVATPQEGISYADVMYECIVEGRQTRLMMLVSDYEILPTVGSVRSSREYYLDFAANHNAIYMHAGGSDQAYSEIWSRYVNNLDGVNDNGVSYRCFWRDTWRMNNMGYEHSLMTSGEKIAAGIAYKKYNTTLANGFDSPLDFVSYDTVHIPEGGSATYLRVAYSNAHKPYFEYNEGDNLYYRWQFLGDKHIDNGNKKQLAFTNIILLYCPTYNTGDSKGHMNVTTTGEGEGYYFTMGKYEKITWKKAGKDTPVKLYNEAGGELLINRGKTFFQICTDDMKPTTEIR